MFSKAALLSLALPAAYGAVHESLGSLPYGWSESSKVVSDSEVMTLQVALQYRNLNSLDQRIQALSDPDSQDYGKYLDVDEMNSIFAPSGKTERRVRSWLEKSGASNIKSDGSLLSFSTTVGHANKLLDTEFRYYTNGKVTSLRTTQYSIPDSLADAVDLVSPTTYFSSVQESSTMTIHGEQIGDVSAISKKCGFAAPKAPLGFLVTPECLKELYSVGDYTPDPNAGSNIAFGSFLNQSASHSDLLQFEKNLNITAHDFKVLQLINGGVNNQDPATESDGEANLDVENIAGLVGSLPIGEYITGGVAPIHPDLLSPNQSVASNEPYLQYYTYLLAQPSKNVPFVITNSYGDHENTVPFKYATRVCNMIGMMGMRGHTVIESSADEGVGAVCRSAYPHGKPQFTPQFPGTCPYVTAVGGTQGFPDDVAWVGSSGGFSNYFAPGFYQEAAINTYLNKYLPASVKHYYGSNQYANFSGRGFPDVSALSVAPYYYNIINNTIVGNGGTSAAAPVFAALVALLNDARFRKNQPSMGFINPFLYKNPSALNDVVKGGSKGCHGRDIQNGIKIPGAGIIPYASWNATTGWDPVTGLGTPNFQNLKKAATSGWSGGW